MSGFVVGLLMSLGGLLIWQAISGANNKANLKLVKKQKAFAHWPDVVDDMHSAVRAGLSLPQAVQEIARTGPLEIREIFQIATEQYKHNGDFQKAMLTIGRNVNDPTGDKFVTALIVAQELGGADLGKLLVALAESLRADLAVRGEIKARQSWTVNGARLAVAAPWLTVLILSGHSETRRMYLSASGINLLIFCAVVSVAAYFGMQRIGRLPNESRMLGT